MRFAAGVFDTASASFLPVLIKVVAQFLPDPFGKLHPMDKQENKIANYVANYGEDYKAHK